MSRNRRNRKTPADTGLTDRVNKFKDDDMTDVDMMVSGLNDCMQHLVQSVNLHLPVLRDAGPERKKEKTSSIRRYHEAAKDIVATRLKLQLLPDAVQSVYEDIDLEQVAADEEDDDQFCTLLDQFEEAATNEAEKRFENVDDVTVDRDEEYQECLELLNTFVDRGSKNKGEKEKSAGKGAKTGVRAGKSNNNTTGVTGQRHSEGLEALTEYIPTKDPITKKTFKDPYVNRVCGHVYDYDSIIGLIHGGNIKCPYPGCTNTSRLNATDLKKDENLARKIAERIQMEEDLD